MSLPPSARWCGVLWLVNRRRKLECRGFSGATLQKSELFVKSQAFTFEIVNNTIKVRAQSRIFRAADLPRGYYFCRLEVDEDRVP